ncbi:MAG TPA: GlsB/YeaQ/YmgE family stress response membrane protein [Thermoanaerobaculia bacterium]|jgi:uncharacterized membrane protein YeaQ/YmgE (transglycosylase-associated protein family)|nr:GlsB/YeaQ/YmgE family stress response membrane protein [Thermoanaerobaculia bacterium]
MAVIHILWSILIGFVVGLIARALMPGAQHLGFLATTALGIVGSLVGGILGAVISRPRQGAWFHPAGLFLSLVGALVVLYLWRFLG